MNKKLINQLMYIQYHECTKDNNDKKKYIKSIKDILEKTSLKERTAEEIWDLTWEKAYFSGVKTAIGRKWVNNIRNEKNGNKLEDFNNIPDSSNSEALKKNEPRFKAVQELAKKFQGCFDLYENVRKAISEMQEDINKPESIEIIRKNLGVKPGSNHEGKLYRDLRIKGIRKVKQGIKHITVLHMLTDYGFPVCKPDIWVMRIAEAFSKSLGNTDNKLQDFIRSYADCGDFEIKNCSEKFFKKEKNAHYVFLIIDYLIKYHFDKDDLFFKKYDIDIKSQFNRYRFVDLIIAKSGMSPEEGFGMYISPFQRLKEDQQLKEKYSEFKKIVDIIDENNRKNIAR